MRVRRFVWHLLLRHAFTLRLVRAHLILPRRTTKWHRRSEAISSILGRNVSGSRESTVQTGWRDLSRLTISRCPFRQGQSNAAQVALSFTPTRITPLAGNWSGISSAASTHPTMRQGRHSNVSNCHHAMNFFIPAMSAPRKDQYHQAQACPQPGRNSVHHGDTGRWWIPQDRGNVAASLWVQARGRSE